MKKRLLELAAIAFWFLTGCAHTTQMSGPIAPAPATLIGRVGEDAPHLYARLLARDCSGDETEHVIAQVAAFLRDCAEDGQSGCELAACDKLRNAMPRRCSDTIALGETP